ncbi:xanthine dehydrogenase family protein molybdopterin-binding subunit [Corticibacterium sp. UT-5YL-CI-8]|nr:xanthine dehydrogenase family protein molybdopterin-binding subunit [Tianweitania sp. UT-5YL-CI-8]
MTSKRESGTVPNGIGRSVKRTEDARFLLGKGRYTDDLRIPGQAYIYVVRSPHAHANITSLDASEAKSASGVVDVLIGSDYLDDGLGTLPCIWQVRNKNGSVMAEPARYPVAVDRVRYVGDAVAVVIAETLDQAKDAADLIVVEYEPLAAVVAGPDAIMPQAPIVHNDAPGNLCFDWEIGNRAATEDAFSRAHHITRLDVINSRIVPNPMEPRSVVAIYDDIADEYTLHTSTQNPHLVRSLLCKSVLRIPEHKVRVVSADVGGGFGVKCHLYPEEVLLTWAARRCGRPVRWTADRSETFLSDAHARDHVTHGELALDSDGTFLGLRVSTVANLGAYLSTWSASIPTYASAPNLAGQYTTPAIYAEVKGVFTNTVPVDAYRGAGRPEANYIVERLIDAAAREMGLDRVEIRRRNLVPSAAMPYATPLGPVYDSGDFRKCLDMAAGNADYEGLAERKQDALRRGKLLGLGVSCYIEACGVSPSRANGISGGRIGGFEMAEIRFNPDGSATVFSGTHSHGQGHETVFAQIVTDKLGVPFESVMLVQGDTARIAFGHGTVGSRSAAVGGSAIVVAGERIVAKGKRIAAHIMEVDVEDVHFEDGEFRSRGTNKVMTIAEIAHAAYLPINYPLDQMDPGLDEICFYDPTNFTFPNGTQICELEIDPQTGHVELKRFVVADDFGRILNPMIVHGQVHGGIAQGVGQALLETVVYDADSGQLLTGSFMDYAMPRSCDLPSFEVSYHEDSPCTHNPLGVKGCGEAGTIGAATAVMNAVLDAMSSVGVDHMDMPASPSRVWRALRAATSKLPRPTASASATAGNGNQVGNAHGE